jgi:hypothetical protein
LPESYKGKNGIFVVEFRKLNSGFDDIAALQDVPIALNLLKSRYTVFENKKIPGPSEKISLTINESDLLKLGYGPGGLTLKDIPGVPPIYFLNLTLSDEVKKYGFVYAGGVATSFEEEQYPPFTEVILKLSDTKNIYGLSTTAIDWALIMLPDVYTEGDDFSLWIYVKQPVEPGVEHACPCQSESCSCIECPYTFLGDYYGQDFYPIHIQVQLQGVKIQIGDTLNINIENTDFLSCADLMDSLPQPSFPMSLP